MMDGRFDQYFADIFSASLANEDKKGERPVLWPLAVACICGLAIFASAAVLG